MSMHLTPVNVSVRILALLTFAGFTTLILFLIWFNQHTLVEAVNQIDKQRELRYLKTERILSIKSSFHQLKYLANQNAGNVRDRALQGQLAELSQILLADWRRLAAAEQDGDLTKRNEFVTMEKVLNRFAQSRYWLNVEPAVSNSEMQQANEVMESLLDLVILAPSAGSKSLRIAIEEHKKQLYVISISVSVILSFGLWWTYRLIVSPLRKLSSVVRLISIGKSNSENLLGLHINLTELAELRDQTHRMVTNLTESNHFLSESSNSLLLMTSKTSEIALQVKGGVIEEHTISKDIFADLREIHIGNQQMQEALLNALQVLATASASDCLDEQDIDELRDQMSLMSDISSGWKALADDLGRVLDGFDDMVRDRMTLANELETLTKVMHNCSKEMAFRAL